MVDATSCRSAEIVLDFYDRLKSLTKGYASMDYEYLDFRPSDLVQARHPASTAIRSTRSR